LRASYHWGRILSGHHYFTKVTIRAKRIPRNRSGNWKSLFAPPFSSQYYSDLSGNISRPVKTLNQSSSWKQMGLGLPVQRRSQVKERNLVRKDLSFYGFRKSNPKVCNRPSKDSRHTDFSGTYVSTCP
jgi:hypothetical protein